MKLYSQKEQYKLYHGNMLDMLEVIEPNTIDSIVCDPPYELNFMGKGWDNSGIAFNKDAWIKCYEALKPGGYLLAFGGTRTYHRIACAIEDAGFEIRDCIMYLYGAGFPKSLNIGLAIDKKNGIDNRTGNIVKGVASNETVAMKNGLAENMEFNNEYEERKATNEWNGWGTALKPAYEPIIVARKPFKTSVAENIMQYGVGGINIDECRIETEETGKRTPGYKKPQSRMDTKSEWNKSSLGIRREVNTMQGRFPANVIHDGSEEAIKDMPNTKGGSPINFNKVEKQFCFSDTTEDKTTGIYDGFNDDGSASRYFYTAKASRKDRDEGLDMFESKYTASAEFRPNHMEKALEGEDGNPYGRWKPVKNIHPTVKNVELMQYLVRLVTPKNGTILDCFMGSGSTGKATMFENRERNANYKFIGIELTEEYLPICEARIDYALNKYEYDFKKELEEAKEIGQQNIFEVLDEE